MVCIREVQTTYHVDCTSKEISNIKLLLEVSRSKDTL